MATLQGALDEIVEVVAAVTGIRYAPHDPSEAVPSWPAAFVYAATSSLENQPAAVVRGLHNPVIAVVMPLNDLARCSRTMMPFIETIPNALFAKNNARTANHWQTFASISVSMGPISWPQGQEMYGLLFTINGLKITNNL